ncbi:MAG: MBL fold metallo-hydrolase [Oscillospiraceae bacterium]|nr:MBL fold metallo-hydrolase [Oscillospiraceae bacterium]MBQ9837182.1 MBL fold metallo-hydrolase [Oscillospiraceae bacterium]
MTLHHVYGNTYAIEAPYILLGLYRLNDHDVILLDTGYALTDRVPLTELLTHHGFVVKGIICTHAHLDHSGNVRYLQEKYGCRVAVHLVEGAIAASHDSFCANYGLATPDGKGSFEECFIATDYIAPNVREMELCGAKFEILHLPGHSCGHIGVVTPDNVAYLSDALMSLPELHASKMPTTQFLHHDIESKRSLHKLEANAYILSHKAITIDIHNIIEANVTYYEGKAQDILGELQGTMTLGNWLKVYCQKYGIRIRNEESFLILEYGFNNLVAYLEELSLVEMVIEEGLRCYRRKGETS